MRETLVRVGGRGMVARSRAFGFCAVISTAFFDTSSGCSSRCPHTDGLSEEERGG